jgi:hypothetical protein
VILVDFRGFDTMGEITVLGVAALGVFSLLYLRLDRGRQIASEAEPEFTAPEVTEVYPTAQEYRQ